MLKRMFTLFLVNVFFLSATLGYPADITGSAEARDDTNKTASLVSLDSLTLEARLNNPEILAAKKRYEASIAKIPQAKSLDNPAIGISLEKIPRGTLKFNKVAAEDRMLSIQQMLPFFGKLPLKGKIALVESQMQAAEYKNKELEVVNELKQAYYDLFMNYKEIGLSQESLRILEGISRIAEAKYAVGEISQEEVFKLHLEIAGLTIDILNLEQENRAKQTRINSLLNRSPEAPLGIPYIDEDDTFNIDTNTLYQLAVLNQPELSMFSYAIEKNKYAKSLAKKSFFPDLMAGLIQRGITSGSIGPWDLMLSFSVPLWFWTKQRYEVKEAIANLEEAEAIYKAMENKAFAEVKGLAVRIDIAKNKIRLYKTSLIPILDSSIKSSLAALSSGKGDFMIFLDTERMLIENKMAYYRALVEYNMNLADLERTVGVELK